MKERIVTALDIGTTKVAALVAKQNAFGKIEILGIGVSQSFGVQRGVVTNIDKTVHAIRKAVEMAEAQSGIKFVEVLVGIAGQHINSLQHRGIIVRDNVDVEIDEEDIKRLINDMHKLSLPPGDKIIHVLPQDYIVDNEQGIKEPIGMAGIRVEGNFHIITGQTAAIQNINKCVVKAGLRVKHIVLEPLLHSRSAAPRGGQHRSGNQVARSQRHPLSTASLGAVQRVRHPWFIIIREVLIKRCSKPF